MLMRSVGPLVLSNQAVALRTLVVRPKKPPEMLIFLGAHIWSQQETELQLRNLNQVAIVS